MAIYLDRLTVPAWWSTFWRWWQDQLKQSIPQEWRDWFVRRTHILIAVPAEETVQFWQTAGDTLAPLTFESNRNTLRALQQSDREVFFTLLLLPGQYLHKVIALPLAAEENLNQVIGFELDRQTPFSADQVYFTSRVLERNPPGRHLKVEVFLTPRELLDRLVIRLHQQGIQPGRVDAAVLHSSTPVPLAIDLLPPRWRPSENRFNCLLNRILTATLAVLLAAILALPILAQNQVLTRLESQVAQARRAAQATTALKQQVTDLEQTARFGLARKQAAPPMIQVIEDLAKRLPQDTWLTGFSYRAGELRIDGSSPSASKLIELLESSPLLHNTHFVSPVTQDRRTGLERFQISLNLGYEQNGAPK
ncbi:MAG: PilN domain-containing protein [Methylohalobius sp.]|nr:PilN domain-containing protein [Methylohalobius sp.]